MRIGRDALEPTIREGLQRWASVEGPNEISLWPDVALRLQERDHGRGGMRQPGQWEATRRLASVAVLCVLLAVSGISVAAAASPAVRTALHHLWPFDSGPVSQGYSPTGAPLYMKPVPHFHVFYPASVPPSLGIHGVGHVLRGGLQNYSPSPFGLTYNCPASHTPQSCAKASSTVWQMFPPAPAGPAFFPAVVSSVARKGIEAVWFGFQLTPICTGQLAPRHGPRSRTPRRQAT